MGRNAEFSHRLILQQTAAHGSVLTSRGRAPMLVGGRRGRLDPKRARS